MARKAAEKKVQEENEAVQLTKEMDKLESKVRSCIIHSVIHSRTFFRSIEYLGRTLFFY